MAFDYLHPQSFSVIFNGRLITIRKGNGQFYDTPNGERKLLTEIQGMKRFPRIFPVSVDQNYNGDVYYTIYLTIHGIAHKLVLTYDRDHPEYQMEAVIEYPRLDTSKMIGHWYRDGKPCYIESWNRSWTALKVATQMRFWLEDYYNEKRYNRSFSSFNYGHDDLDFTDKIIGRSDSWRFW